MFRIFITIFLFGAAISHSQQSSEKGLKVRFLAQQIPRDLGKVVLAAEEYRSASFDLPMNNLSKPQKPPVRLFEVRKEEGSESIATVKLPEEGNSFVVLLLTSAKGGYSPVVMPFDNPNFRGGDIYFYNNANKTISGLVGKTKFTLTPGKSTIATPSGLIDDRYYHVRLAIRETNENRVFKSMKWPSSKTMRNYVFFYVDPKSKRITYRAVDEFVLPVTSEP